MLQQNNTDPQKHQEPLLWYDTITKQNNTDPQTQHELLLWYDTITKHNYFTNNKDTIIQQDGLPMGAPSSGLIPEIFLQYIEHQHLAYLAHTHTQTYKLLEIR
jgi:hypothetical protein